MCKFNVVNLNKQVKLFNHGMQPAVRVGENGKWERLKENLTYKVRLRSAQADQQNTHFNRVSDVRRRFRYFISS